jgi:hypothetical protein
MKDDPIIAELHAIREAHAARFDFDFDRISADLSARQERSRQGGQTFVSLGPRSFERVSSGFRSNLLREVG